MGVLTFRHAPAGWSAREDNLCTKWHAAVRICSVLFSDPARSCHPGVLVPDSYLRLVPSCGASSSNQEDWRQLTAAA